MSKNASPLHPVDPVGDLALDWQIGRVFWQPASSQNNSPPGGVVLLGVAAGALEGVIVGIAHGGFDCVILSLLWGVMIGVCASIYVWRIRENVRHIVLSMLLGIAIETIGGFLIVFFTPMFVRGNIGRGAVDCVSGIAISIPVLLAIRLIYREILGAIRGLIYGMILSAIAFMIPMCFIMVQETGPVFGTAVAIGLGCIIAVLMGIVFGFFVGPVVGALLAALTNVNRRTILPTYGGLIAAVGLGLAGWFAGEAVKEGIGGFVGVCLGVSYGALAGVKLGRLAAACLVRRFLGENEEVPRAPLPLDLSDPREMADSDDLHLLLYYLLLLAIRQQLREVRIEPRQSEYAIAIQDSSFDFAPPLPLHAGRGLEQILKEMAGFDHREGHVHLQIGRCQVEMDLRFEPTPHGERIIMNYRHDPDAAKQGDRIANKFLFIRRARKWFATQLRLGKPHVPFSSIATVFQGAASP
jgi:hypothetical protein